MTDLRNRLIRLAHERPELRNQLLPLIKEAGCEKLPNEAMVENCKKKQEEAKDNDKEASMKTAAPLDGLYKGVERALSALDKEIRKINKGPDRDRTSALMSSHLSESDEHFQMSREQWVAYKKVMGK